MNRFGMILIFLLLASCSPNVVGIYNPGSLKSTPTSYHVYSSDEIELRSEKEQEFDQKLVNIIAQNLDSKGLENSSLPDIYISFIINVHSTEETQQTNYNSYDYRYNNNRYYDPYRYESQSYKQGVLIIDVKNADNKLVWQGSGSFKLSAKKSSREELLARCLEIISSYDPKKIN